MSGEFSITGIAEVLQRLERAGERMAREVEKALYAEAQIEARESMQRTPVDTGALRASHEVHQPIRDPGNGEITCMISVGGPAAPYALYVHENLDAYHPVGQAKFLESTVLESAPHMLERVARRLRMRDIF